MKEKNKNAATLLGQGASVIFSYVCIWFLTLGTLAMFLDVFVDSSWMVMLQKDFTLTADVFGNRERILNGMIILANCVLKKWSEYYGVWIPALKAGSGGDAELMSALLLLSLIIFLWEALCVLCFRRKLPAMLPGLLVFALDLLVGYAPNFLSMFLFVAGSLGSLPFCRKRYGMKGKKDQGKLAIHQGISGACLVAGLVLGLGITEFVAGDHTALAKELHSDVLNWQRNLETKITSLDFWKLWNVESGVVSNQAPEYEGKDVLRVSMTEKPTDTVYLRGYVGDTYQKGTWINTSEDDFSKETAEWPEDIRSRAGYNLLNMAYRTGKYLVGAEAVSYEISYLDADNDYAYLPYFVDLDSVIDEGRKDAGIFCEAEAMILRDGAESLAVEGVAAFPVVRIAIMETSGLFIPGELVKVTKLPNRKEFTEFMEQPELTEQSRLAEWYAPYMEKYRNVPEDLEQIEELGQELTAELETLYEPIGGEEKGIAWKIAAAQVVQQELFRRAEYSLTLSEVPFGEDVVEYFLFDSGKGFCQHYAAAGTLLLREMGIPARYVTGYAVSQETFKWVSANKYEADVKDEYAHAWVEIYLDGQGWFPVEMTEGGVNAANSAGESVREERNLANVTYEEQPENAQRQGEDNPVESTEKIESHNGKAENAEEMSENSKNSQNIELNKPGKKGNEGNTSSGQEGSGEKLFSAALWVLLMAAAVTAAAVCLIRYLDQRAEKKLLTQKDRRKAVRSISERTYRILRRRGVLGVGKIDDKAYREALRTKIKGLSETDLDEYFKVLERAAFDCREISREEVQVCIQFYKKVKGNNVIIQSSKI